MAKKGKSTKKYDAVKALVIKKLAVQHEVTEGFVRQAVNEDKHSETAEQIKKDYRTMYAKLQSTLEV